MPGPMSSEVWLSVRTHPRALWTSLYHLVMNLHVSHKRDIKLFVCRHVCLVVCKINVESSAADQKTKSTLLPKKPHHVCLDGSDSQSIIQYIPRYMHTDFALLCFVVVIHWLIFPYPSGLLHWHCGNLTIAPVPAKQPWWIWINTSCEFTMNDYITTTKQSTTKPCANFLGYTVIRNLSPAAEYFL